jgi:hypothetical protein
MNDSYQPGRPLLLPAVEDAVIEAAPYAAAAGARAYSGEVSIGLRDLGSSTHLKLSSF